MVQVNAFYVIAIILIVIGIILIGVAATISGIISINQTGGVKTSLLTSTIFAMLGDLIAIVAAIVGIIYAGKKLSGSKSTRSYLIAFIILLIAVLIIYVIVIGIDIGVRNNVNLVQSQKGALTSAVIIFAAGLISIGLGATFIFLIYSKGGAKGYKSLREGYTSIRSESGPVIPEETITTHEVKTSH